MAGAKPAIHVVQLKPINVPETLVKGNKFIKWDDSSQLGVPVTLKVDPKGYILYWRDQNKDMDALDISSIRDTRTGKYARIPKEGKLRDSCTIGPSDIPLEDKTVTICYGSDMVNVEFVNFVCASREVATEFCDELLSYANNLLCQNGSAVTFLEKAHTKLTHVLDVNGKIPVKNIIKMVTKDNKDDRKRAEKALEAAGFKVAKNDTIDPGKFTFEDFFTFYRHLVGRTEVDKVFDEMGPKKKPYMTTEQFVRFLNKEQRDPRLNEILYPYYTSGQALELILRNESKANMASKGHLSTEGFLKFLMGEENNLIPADYLDLSQDMTQPLTHYFINSSHNTYLTGHQFTGRSSVEIYQQVLLSGCRCIELDCWDGRGQDEEPIITHGYTMCTEILFKEVIEAIAASAFKTSEWPVILSFENHCNVKQQAKMAAYCRSIFGDMLLVDPMEGFELETIEKLPSPENMKRKIIVKNRKKHFHKSKQKVSSPKASSGGRKMKTSSVDNPDDTVGEERKQLENQSESVERNDEYDSDSSSSEDDDDMPGLTEEEEKERQREKREKGTAGSEAEAGMEMSALVNYVQPVHFHSFDVSEKKSRCYEISSFVETQATNLLKEYPVEFVNYNKRQLSRIYPRGTRVDSSNFMPQIFWNAGCQLVALNFQTLDLAMQLNLGIFEYNNKSGYILKPDFMRRSDRHFDPFAESTVDGIVANTVSVRVISGQMLSDKKIGTYVEVDMYGLPTDTHRKKFKTKTVPNNGINPVYDEKPFVFKKVVLPNLAVIRIAVYDENNSKLIGHRVLAVEALRPGYRHISLRNECNQPLHIATVFVHISVQDYVSDRHAEFAEALANPLEYLSKIERHEKQLAKLEDFEEQQSEDDQSDPGSVPGGRRESNPSPSKPGYRRNGSLPSVFSTNGSTEAPSKLNRTPSNPQSAHSYITKKESQESSVSAHSNSSGMNLRTRFSEPSLLTPTPLPELKKDKMFFKMLVKRDKDLEMLKKKHEKCRENMQEIHEVHVERLIGQQIKDKGVLEKSHSKNLKRASKEGMDINVVQRQNHEEFVRFTAEQEQKLKELRKSNAEVFVEMCKSHFQAELDVYIRHNTPIYETLRVVMDQNHKEHINKLQLIHDQEVKDLTKRMEAESKEQMRQLAKKHKDKQAISRLKRENQKRHIDTMVAERSKLKQILDQRLEELDKKLDGVKEELEKDKKLSVKEHEDHFHKRCNRLEDEFRDLLTLDIRGTAQHSNGTETHFKTQL